jgi:spermidine synthase
MNQADPAGPADGALAAGAPSRSDALSRALLVSVFVIAACGLVYELIAGALSSYLLGDSVTQFSLAIGVYLAAMGLGSWLSRYIVNGVIARFYEIELAIAALGGFSATLMFIAFAHLGDGFRVVLYGTVTAIGVLVGLEIPLVMRILRERLGFRELVAQVLTADYLGALAVSMAFPMILAPRLGLIRTAFLFGLMNAAVAAWALWIFRAQLQPLGWRVTQCAVVSAFLSAGFVGSERLTRFVEDDVYADQVIYAGSSRHQRIVVTTWRNDVRLHLNGNLQFSSRDEYRYHEALVHPALGSAPWARRVLVLGGGDGLAVREVLRYPHVESVTLVDLDPEITRIFATAPLLRKLNAEALNSPRVKIVNADAFKWLEESGEHWDVVIADFPDPSNYSLGKLYTTAFYQLLERRLTSRGLAVVQATSPLHARRSFWCVVTTLEDSGFRATPYHANVPSFGEWGFIIATRGEYQPPARYELPLKFVSPELHPALFHFPPDMARVPAEVNRLNNQVLVQYFDKEWRRAPAH